MKSLNFSVILSIILQFVIICSASAQSNTINCFPQQHNFWTGSATSAVKTDSATIYGIGQGKRGWIKFDVSSIPDNSIITDIRLYYYVQNASVPYYRFTKLNADPVTTSAQNLYSIIGQANSGTSTNTYYDYSASQQSGQVNAVLNSYARSDLQAALYQNWFSVGVYEYDASSNYYISISGWNTNYMPVISVSYTPAYQNDIGISNITSPSWNSQPGTNTIKAIIKNYGSNTVYSAHINWTIDGIAQPVYLFNDTLAPGAYKTVTVGNHYFATGTHTISTCTSLPNNTQDLNTANDCKNITINFTYQSVYCLLDSIEDCNMDTIGIKMSVYNFSHVGSFSLQIKYDTTKLNYLYFSGVPSTLPCISNLNVSKVADTLIITYTCPQPAGFNYDSILYLYFTPTAQGYSPISFVNTNTSHCYFSDTAGYHFNAYFNTGYVYHSQPPDSAGAISGPVLVCPGQDSIIYSIPLLANAQYYTWVLPNGTTGSSTSNSISLSFGTNFSDGHLYVYGMNECGNGQASHIHISACPSQDSTICFIPSVTGCEGTLHFPVIIKNAENLSSISLGILYDSLHLSYQGYSNPYSGLLSGILFVNPFGSSIQIGWFSVTPANFENDTMLCLDFIADTGFSELIFDLQTLGVCYMTDINNQPLNVYYTNASVFTGTCAEVSGKITYDNSLSSPVSNTQIRLLHDQSPIYTTQSDAGGNYLFGGVSNNTYQLGALVSKTAGGINSADAMLVLKHYVHLYNLNGLKLQAADVDGTGFVNASDALMIAKKFVGMISNFPVGSWLVPQPTVNVASNGQIAADLKAICYGDVDGSFIPGVKQSPSLELTGNGQEALMTGNTLSIPLISMQDARACAISLIIKLQDKEYILNNIKCDFNGNLLYKQEGAEIRISWYSLEEMDINAGNVIMTLNLEYNSTKRQSGDNLFFISADGESNAADREGMSIEGFSIAYPDHMNISNNSLYINPNPVNNECSVNFRISKSSAYTMRLYNSQGQQLWDYSSTEIPEGTYSKKIDMSNYSKGMYILVFEDCTGISKCRIIKE